MNQLNLLPKYEANGIIDGRYLHCLQFCKKNYNKGKCKDFYKNINNISDGYHTCPYGMSVYVENSACNPLVFCGFRERSTYNKPKAKSIIEESESIYNPILSSAQTDELIAVSKQISQISLNSANILDETHEVIHETKKLNGQIKNLCEQVWIEFDSEDLSLSDVQGLFDYIRSISTCSSIAFSRFSMFDYFTNPSSFYTSKKVKISIYRKFDKMKRMLRGYLKKDVNIIFNGNSYSEHEILPSFEIVPFLLLENAVKYSPEFENVTVSFSEKFSTLTVKIISIGPFCEATELDEILNKGYRGINAKLAEPSGHGVGLYSVNQLCELHNIPLCITSDYKKQINGIPYGTFCVELVFSTNN